MLTGRDLLKWLEYLSSEDLDLPIFVTTANPTVDLAPLEDYQIQKVEFEKEVIRAIILEDM